MIDRFVFEAALPERVATLTFFPLRSTVPATPIVKFDVPNAVVLPAASVPADTVVVPLYVLFPDRVTVPGLIDVTPPAPLMTPGKTWSPVPGLVVPSPAKARVPSV